MTLDLNWPICEADCRLVDDGTLDTVVLVRGEVEVRYAIEEAAPYRDDAGVLDFDAFVRDHIIDIDDCVWMQLGA